MDSPRILLLIPHLGGGGAERVAVLLARHLAERYETHLGIVLARNQPQGQTLPEAVAIHCLGASRVRCGAGPLLRLVWRLQPDVILSGMAHLNFLVLLLRPFLPAKTRVIVRQNGTVSAALAVAPHPHRTRGFYRLLYPRADSIVCQSAAMAEDLARELRISRNKLAVLPNPIEIDAIRAASAHPHAIPWKGSGPRLLAVGRLAPEKGFDLLIAAMALLQSEYPTIELAIAGVGAEEASLRAQTGSVHLAAHVHFLGHVARTEMLFPSADLFVLSSRQEGMPNALLEAAAAGLPLVATPASQGLVELLRGQPGCWLAAEASATSLASALRIALHDQMPVHRCHHAFIEAFRAERAVAAYAALITEVLVEGNQ